ncbi:TetR/AcrR family transcriptional regulator [Nocardia panacis]|uniref:TetR/AcrR family transcriptional regulator n=1 Tax=Nocardia panacis TaxID=2340916 RepID=A0A3A4KDX9_9NOCA|nr:helix-turn-helix domain-containing protein [Nocardia panacis]RJO72262.1 TetR/AcrR family transcriptional regulator [Nocardia panacis]
MSAGDRRAQLLDVARDIVAADGFGAVTIERVAREAEVARALVYQQFTDLSGLMTAMLDREMGIALAGVAGVKWSTDTVDQVARSILDYLQAAPASWQIMLSPPDGGPPNLRARLELGRSYARASGARHLSRFSGTEVDPNGPTERILVAALEELARLHLDNPLSVPDDVLRNYIAGLLHWAIAMETGS